MGYLESSANLKRSERDLRPPCRCRPSVRIELSQKSMNRLPPDLSGSTSGRGVLFPNSSLFDHTLTGEGHPGVADALLDDRLVAAAGGDAGALDSLLQQELRRQEGIRSSGSFASAAFSSPLDREELLRLQDAHNRRLDAELAAHALRDRVAASQGAQAQAQNDALLAESIERQAACNRELVARGDRLVDSASITSAYCSTIAPTNMISGLANTVALPTHLTDEIALRRLVQLEEETIRQHHYHRQQQAAALHSQQQVALDNHQALMGLVAGLGSVPAATTSTAEREYLSRLLQIQHMQDNDLILRAAEVQNAQGSTLQACLDRNKVAALEQRLLEGRLLQSGLQQFREPPSNSHLRPDLDTAHADAAVARGKPPDTITNSAQQRNLSSNARPLRFFNNGIEVDIEGGPLQNNGGMNRPPPDQGNTNNTPTPANTNLVTKFLAVVESRVPEIRPAIANILPQGDDLKHEFPKVVEATLAELKSIKERAPSEIDQRRVNSCIADIEPYKDDLNVSIVGGPLPGVAADIVRPGLPLPSVGFNSYHPLMLTDPMSYIPVPASVPSLEHLATTQQVGSFKENTDTNPLSLLDTAEDMTKPGSPLEDVPMMAAYKSTKKAAKEAKRRSKAKSKKKMKPRVVHRALSKSSVDLKIEEKTNSNSSPHSKSSRESLSLEVENCVKPKLSKKCQFIASNSEKSASNSKYTPTRSSPIGANGNKKGRVKNKSNGKLFHQLFATSRKPTTAVEDTSKLERQCDNKKQSSDNLLVAKSNQSVRKDCTLLASDENEDDSKLNAASVLLDLMGK